MAFDIEISRDFSAYNHEVEVNQIKLQTLCEIAAAGQEIPTLPSIGITPGIYFGMNLFERMAHDDKMLARYGRHSLAVLDGEYRAGSNHISLYLNGNERQANNRLRHEVLHWAEDAVLGISEDDPTRAVAGVPGIVNHRPLSVRDYLTYRNLPHERRARRFASDHKVKALVGKIIELRRVG